MGRKNTFMIAVAAAACLLIIALVVRQAVKDSQEGKNGKDAAPGISAGQTENAKPEETDPDSPELPEESEREREDGFAAAFLPDLSQSYLNDRLWSYEYEKGCFFTFGLQNGGHRDAIYLNPTVYDKVVDRKVGFYIESERKLTFYDEDRVFNGPDGTLSSYLIPDHTYDCLVPAVYLNDSSFGILWRNDLLGQEQFCGDTIYIRGVDLKSGALLACLRLTVSYDAEKGYFISGLSSNDVRITGELTEDLRTDAIEKALAFAQENEVIRLGKRTGLDEERIRNTSVVEKVPSVYFNRLISVEGDKVNAGEYAGCGVIAVNIPAESYGFITVYLTEEKLLVGDYNASFEELTVFGYDALYPFSALSQTPSLLK